MLGYVNDCTNCHWRQIGKIGGQDDDRELEMDTDFLTIVNKIY